MADQLHRRESGSRWSSNEQGSTLGNLFRNGSLSRHSGSQRSQGGDSYRNRLHKEQTGSPSFATVGSRYMPVHPTARVDTDKVRENPHYAFNGESFWMIERVFAARNDPFKREAARQVLVKWVGWPKPTWEPLKNFVGKDALIDFTQRHGDPEINDGPKDIYQRWFTS